MTHAAAETVIDLTAPDFEPHITTIRKLAEALGVTPGDLLD